MSLADRYRAPDPAAWREPGDEPMDGTKIWVDRVYGGSGPPLKHPIVLVSWRPTPGWLDAGHWRGHSKGVGRVEAHLIWLWQPAKLKEDT